MTKILWIAAFPAFLATTSLAYDFKSEVSRLVESSCIYCHDADTETRLNFEELSHDLRDPDAFRTWEKVLIV